MKNAGACRKFLLAIVITIVLSIYISALMVYAESDAVVKTGFSAVRTDTYRYYEGKNKNVDKPSDIVKVDISSSLIAQENCRIEKEFEGSGEPVIVTSEEGYAEWNVNVNKPGLYNIQIRYFPIEGRSSNIEREIHINGEIPFFEAGHIILGRVWADEGKGITRDNRGNDIRPSQVEKPRWETKRFSDTAGSYAKPYLFYFKQGINKIRLVSVREPAAIESLELLPEENLNTYDQVLSEYKTAGYKAITGVSVKVQGEKASYKSDPSLYPIFDRSSSATEPYNKSKIRLNTIGGDNWRQPGQWISWEIEAPESGLYKLDLKVRQNIVRGVFTNRRLTIDGKVPFKEMDNIRFKYKNKWINYIPGKDEQPYLFYLEKGKHEIKLETTMGDLTEIANAIEDSIYQLNYVYRKIVIITGATPDTFRDYQLDKQMPEAMEVIKTQSEVLKSMSAKLYAATGQKGSSTALLDAFSYQLQDLYKRPHTIPSRLQEFQENISALGTWVLDLKEQPLEVDYLVLASPEWVAPTADTGLISKLFQEIRSFISSFTEDYNSIGDVYKNKSTIKVWIETGRDQAQVLKNMIDSDFTPKTGIQVNLRVVQPSMLLPATVAGKGPDVVLSVDKSEPVNYALRKAVEDISKFPDYTEIEKRFHSSAIVPLQFNGGVYALPETQNFMMLFYRDDILKELGLEVPQTWDDVYAILPTIQKNNMNFGIPVSQTTTGGVTMQSLAMFIYQNGGSFYKENGKSSALESENDMKAFKQLTELFQNYKLPQYYDFGNRFRTGEMPIAINYYSFYNFFSVFAPEIQGLWGFAPVPGVMQSDGSIKRSIPAAGLCTMLMKQAKDKDSSWMFMKWWTSASVQEKFGKEMESLMGGAARYQTANLDALKKLPWSVSDYNNLMEQWKWLEGIPEVPGSYYMPRYIDNAFRKVVYSGADARETMLDYKQVVDEEITSKRKEFGLATTAK